MTVEIYARQELVDLIGGYVAFGHGDPTFLPVYKTKAEGEIQSYHFNYSLGSFVFTLSVAVKVYFAVETGAVTLLQKCEALGAMGIYAYESSIQSGTE